MKTSDPTSSSNTDRRPAVSVLLPTYNQARFLPDALAGLKAQTFRDFEIRACDDGSTDDTENILRESLPIENWGSHFRNYGTAAAINEAAHYAQGDLLTWVSSDNVMHPDWLATLVDAMGPDVGAVYSDYIRDEGDKRGLCHVGPYARARLISSEACYFGPSFLIRREVWPEHRGGTAHDYDSWLRVEEACWAKGLAIRYVDRVLCTYRAGPWCTGRARPELYDAPKWREEALRRRLVGKVVSVNDDGTVNVQINV